ncbi:MAG: alpha/beta hydrolase [Chloroflexota bacterium]
MITKIILGIVAIAVIGGGILLAIYYKPDLSKAQLSEYISGESEFITLPNGATMHYRDEGNPDGPVLVMVHGGFGALHNWEGWIPYLKDDYRLISMDLLGHGLTGLYPDNIYTRISVRDTIHMLLQELNLNRYTVAGNSWGGGIALEMGLEYPDEVEGLILVDSEGIPNSEEGYDVSTLTDEKPTTPDDPRFATLSWMEKLGSKFIGPAVVRSTLDSMIYNKDLITDEFVNYFGRIIRFDGNREAQILMFRQGLHQVSQNGPQDLLPRLGELQMPTLVVHGKQDTLVPLRVSETFDANIANSELAIIDEAGHMPMIEKPEETAQAVVAFFEKYKIGN